MRSQHLTRPSVLPETRRVPSGLNATDLTELAVPGDRRALGPAGRRVPEDLVPSCHRSPRGCGPSGLNSTAK